MPESSWRRAINGLGPYQSLVLLLVPLGIVEPLKLKPKLLTLDRFAKAWNAICGAPPARRALVRVMDDNL
jgi:hypothetical protein